MNIQKNAKPLRLLYLLELAPHTENLLEKISVQQKVDQILHTCAQNLDFEIDSCDVMFDFVALTMYVQPSVDIDQLIMNIAELSSNLLVQDAAELKSLMQDDNLWSPDYNLELLQ